MKLLRNKRTDTFYVGTRYLLTNVQSELTWRIVNQYVCFRIQWLFITYRFESDTCLSTEGIYWMQINFNMLFKLKLLNIRTWEIRTKNWNSTKIAMGLLNFEVIGNYWNSSNCLIFKEYRKMVKLCLISQQNPVLHNPQVKFELYNL